MYELIFHKNGVTTRRHEKDPLTSQGVWVDIRTTRYEDLPEDSLSIVVKSIRPQIENGVLRSLTFEVTSFGQVETEVEKSNETEKSKDVSSVLDNLADYYRTYYRQLSNPRTEPYTIRDIIKNRGRISRSNLVEELKNRGYSESGSVNATINVLEKVTKEIRREGRGENTILVWIGEQKANST